MNTTAKFILFVCGIALLVHGVSLIPTNATTSINPYLVIGLGASIAFIVTLNIKEQ